jgi:hypothetical protein
MRRNVTDAVEAVVVTVMAQLLVFSDALTENPAT